MKKALITLMAIFAASFNLAVAQPVECPDVACATPIGGGAGKQTTTRWYTGLVWELGGQQGMTPDVVFGVRSLTVKNIDAVTGVDANLRLKIKNSSFGFDSARIAYVGGKPSLLANAGIGYSFTHATPIATAALQASYLRLSTDYLWVPQKFQLFGELNTLKKPEKVGGGQLACADSEFYALTDVAVVEQPGYLTVPASAIVDGKTCFQSI